MNRQSLVESFNAAIEGFVYVTKTQRNMRLHFMAGLIVLLAGVFLNFTHIELIILLLLITLVIMAEMFNTAIEHTIDLVKEEFHPLARIIKDICAGAVLLSALCAIVTGYMLFANRLGLRLEDNIVKIRESSWHLTFLTLLIVLGIVIVSKLFLRRGTPFRGGMPSGHSAIAFSIWAIVSMLYPKSVVIVLVFILAFFVARSRVRDKVHTRVEVVTGALLGAIVTVLVFQILRK